MHISHTEMMDMHGHFRSELSRLMSVMRSTIEKYTNIRRSKYDVREPPCASPSTDECEGSCTTSIILSIHFPESSLPFNGPWWLGTTVVFDTICNIFTGDMIFDILFFIEQDKSMGVDKITP